jgi:hypothetical protein
LLELNQSPEKPFYLRKETLCLEQGEESWHRRQEREAGAPQRDEYSNGALVS